MSAYAPPKSLWYALATNLALALAALVTTLYTGSVAMQAQSVLALVLAVHQGLLLWSLQWRKAEGGGRLYFASFTGAVMLFCLGGLYAMYEGVRRLSDAEAIQAAWLPLMVLLLGAVAQLVAVWAAVQTANRHRGADAVGYWLRSMRRRDLIVLVAECLLALFGLLLTLLCVALAAMTDSALYDAFGAIATGGVLLMLAGWVAAQINHLLQGGGVGERQHAALDTWLRTQSGVDAVEALMITLRGEQWLVTARVRLAACDEAARQAQLAALDASLRASFSAVRWVYLVPLPPASGEPESAADPAP